MHDSVLNSRKPRGPSQPCAGRRLPQHRNCSLRDSRALIGAACPMYFLRTRHQQCRLIKLVARQLSTVLPQRIPMLQAESVCVASPPIPRLPTSLARRQDDSSALTWVSLKETRFSSLAFTILLAAPLQALNSLICHSSGLCGRCCAGWRALTSSVEASVPRWQRLLAASSGLPINPDKLQLWNPGGLPSSTSAMQDAFPNLSIAVNMDFASVAFHWTSLMISDPLAE